MKINLILVKIGIEFRILIKEWKHRTNENKKSLIIGYPVSSI